MPKIFENSAEFMLPEWPNKKIEKDVVEAVDEYEEQ